MILFFRFPGFYIRISVDTIQGAIGEFANPNPADTLDVASYGRDEKNFLVLHLSGALINQGLRFTRLMRRECSPAA